MDYKYINQLLDRYWMGATSLEEEDILRTFFSQDELPAELAAYKALFAYQHRESKSMMLGEDFDQKVMDVISSKEKGETAEESKLPQQTRIISLTERLKPLFKAAAIVAIVLTLGNAIQVPFNNDSYTLSDVETVKQTQSTAEAITDSARIDTMQRSSLELMPVQQSPNILK